MGCGLDHACSPFRPEGLTSSTTSISRKGRVAARLDIFTVINPPTLSAHSPAPNRPNSVARLASMPTEKS